MLYFYGLYFFNTRRWFDPPTTQRTQWWSGGRYFETVFQFGHIVVAREL